MTTNRDLLLLLILCILVFLVYSNSFQVPFNFDDKVHIIENSQIRITRITFESIRKAAFHSPSVNRPVSNLSFALNHFFHGYTVWGYHFINVLIHIINGALLYFFTKTTLTLPSLRHQYEGYKWLPFLAADFGN